MGLLDLRLWQSVLMLTIRLAQRYARTAEQQSRNTVRSARNVYRSVPSIVSPAAFLLPILI
jgi:hypothetical protein